MEKTREQLKAELRALYSLLKRARIECRRPAGRFGEDTCGTCAGCVLLRKIERHR